MKRPPWFVWPIVLSIASLVASFAAVVLAAVGVARGH